MSETLAKDWWQARKAGKHLPEHEFVTCELCGEPMNVNPEIHDTTGMHVCVPCIEATL